jgi:hypothetical protein
MCFCIEIHKKERDRAHETEGMGKKEWEICYYPNNTRQFSIGHVIGDSTRLSLAMNTFTCDMEPEPVTMTWVRYGMSERKTSDCTSETNVSHGQRVRFPCRELRMCKEWQL